MDHLNIKLNPGVKVVVTGDIHGADKQFFELIDKVKPSEKMLFVSVGDVFDKSYKDYKIRTEAENKIVNYIKQLSEEGIGYIVQGNHEAKRIRRSKELTPELIWLNRQPYALSFVFCNNTRLTVIHGGVKPSHTWDDLRENNSDLLYIKTLDENGDYIKLRWVKENGRKILKAEKLGKPWQEFYQGNLGYCVSGHFAQEDGEPKFYKYACNLDTCIYKTGILTAQVFSEKGREELIQIKGEVVYKK